MAAAYEKQTYLAGPGVGKVGFLTPGKFVAKHFAITLSLRLTVDNQKYLFLFSYFISGPLGFFRVRNIELVEYSKAEMID